MVTLAVSSFAKSSYTEFGKTHGTAYHGHVMEIGDVRIPSEHVGVVRGLAKQNELNMKRGGLAVKR